MTWRLARSLTTLQAEVNDTFPNRPTAADGTIGDPAHAARVSDHNPNSRGVVTAWDITTAPFCDLLAEKLRAMGRAGDGRVKYVIWKRHITSPEHGWQWASYPGDDPHTGHIHLSVSADPRQYDRTDHWHVFTPVQEDDMTPEQDARLKNIEKLLKALVAPRLSGGADRDPNAIDLGDILNDDKD